MQDHRKLLIVDGRVAFTGGINLSETYSSSSFGIEPDEAGWIHPTTPPATLKALLAEMGRVYAPVMLANARALPVR